MFMKTLLLAFLRTGAIEYLILREPDQFEVDMDLKAMASHP